mmetsp:Transcript_120123/g.245555  ORF Transcript_120123/g.245555 Transcript_120123/m.245555 type:complete len:83 (+) Transcript_120123:1815-2063(+)
MNNDKVVRQMARFDEDLQVIGVFERHDNKDQPGKAAGACGYRSQDRLCCEKIPAPNVPGIRAKITNRVVVRRKHFQQTETEF